MNVDLVSNNPRRLALLGYAKDFQIHCDERIDGAAQLPKGGFFVRGHDKSRLMGVASHRSFPGGIYSILPKESRTTAIFT